MGEVCLTGDILFVGKIGGTATEADSRAEYQSWHYQDALQLSWSQALEAYPSFGKDQTYVLYCEYGLKSAHLAEMMRAVGLRGLHFKGGTRALRRLAERRPSA